MALAEGEKVGAQTKELVALEDVAGIDLVGHVGQTFIETIGDDDLRLLLEGFERIDYARTKEAGAGFERGLALMRFMMPWMADWRKLSELLFIVRR